MKHCAIYKPVLKGLIICSNVNIMALVDKAKEQMLRHMLHLIFTREIKWMYSKYEYIYIKVSVKYYDFENMYSTTPLNRPPQDTGSMLG